MIWQLEAPLGTCHSMGLVTTGSDIALGDSKPAGGVVETRKLGVC